MGFLDGKISFLMILVSCVSAFFLLLPNLEAGSDETSVILKVFKLPEYNKDTGDLDYIIYGEEANNVGVIVNLKQLKVDWIGRDVKDIKGTVTTPSGIYDRVAKIIRGDDEVHFRSAAMDVDGVGFDADQKKQTIHIRSKVKVFLRGNLMTDKENADISTQDKKDKK
jgi:hypothetical protein